MQTDCFPESVANWPKGTVSKRAQVNPRYRVKKGRDYPFVEMAAVDENFAGILNLDWRRLESSGLSRFKTGDTLFAGGIGRSDFPGGDSAALVTAIRERLLTLPDETVIYSGHGPQTTVAREKSSNPFLA